MADAVMLDIETIDTGTRSVILTVGAVKFNPYASTDPHSPFYEHIDVDEQFAMDRTYSEDTIAWWAKQPDNIREEAFGEHSRLGVQEFLAKLNKYMVGVGDIWCQGPVFDIPIIESLYADAKKPVPWHYWQIRDSRTLFSVIGDPREKSKDDLHNALADAYNQAIGVQLIYKKLGVQKNDARNS